MHTYLCSCRRTCSTPKRRNGRSQTCQYSPSHCCTPGRACQGRTGRPGREMGKGSAATGWVWAPYTRCHSPGSNCRTACNWCCTGRACQLGTCHSRSPCTCRLQGQGSGATEGQGSGATEMAQKTTRRRRRWYCRSQTPHRRTASSLSCRTRWPPLPSSSKSRPRRAYCRFCTP